MPVWWIAAARSSPWMTVRPQVLSAWSRPHMPSSHGEMGDDGAGPVRVLAGVDHDALLGDAAEADVVRVGHWPETVMATRVVRR